MFGHLDGMYCGTHMLFVDLDASGEVLGVMRQTL